MRAMRVPLVAARAVDDVVFPLSLQVFKCEMESMPSLPLCYNSAPLDECRVDRNALVSQLLAALKRLAFHIANESRCDVRRTDFIVSAGLFLIHWVSRAS